MTGTNPRATHEDRIKALEEALSVRQDNPGPGVVSLREYVEARFAVVERRLDIIDAVLETLKESKARLEGKASASAVYILYGLTIVGLIISVINMLR